MRVYLIRHAESENNVIADRVLAMGLPDSDARQILEQERSKDPNISERGHTQARQLGNFMERDEELMNGDVRFYSSPMSRALQTSMHVFPSLRLRGGKPMIRTDIHEVGGMYKNDENGVAVGYGGLTNAEICEKYPGFDASPVGPHGWWDASRGRESKDEARNRAQVVAEWLLSLEREAGGAVVMVSHADFLDMLITRLIMPNATGEQVQRFGGWFHDNTGVTELIFGLSIYHVTKTDWDFTEDDGQVHIIRANRIEHYYLPLAEKKSKMQVDGNKVVHPKTREEVTSIYGDIF